MEFDQATIFLQSDTVATIYFAAVFVWLLFEGGGYFFGKPADMNDGWECMSDTVTTVRHRTYSLSVPLSAVGNKLYNINSPSAVW